MSSLGHWTPEDGFHLLRQQGQTIHSVRTRCLVGKNLHLDRRQVQDHFCTTCHRHHHHQKSNIAKDTDHRACKGQQLSLLSSSSSSSAQVRNWRSDRSEPLARGVYFSLSSSSSSFSSSSSSSFCPELVFEQSVKTVTAQTSAEQTLWQPISSGSSSSSSSSSSKTPYCGSEDDSWSNNPGAPTQHDTCRHHNSSQYNTHRGGARAHMGIGGRGAIGGGTGESPDPSSGVHPGHSGRSDADGSNGSQSANDVDMDGMADEDGRKLPSSYTFRRRNAVVEGSEDAPRAKDFYPDASRN